MSSIIAKLKIHGQTERLVLKNCVSFSLEKDRYTPFSKFSGKFFIENDIDDIIDIKVIINTKLLHFGPIKTYQITSTCEGKYITITSHGFSESLLINKVEIGEKSEIKYNVTLSNLLDDYYSLPNITYEYSPESVDYLYIIDQTILWNLIIYFSLKMDWRYPFITECNRITYNPRYNIHNIILDSSNALSYSWDYDYKKIYSNLHMRDINGKFDNIDDINQFAIDRNFIEHKFVGHDKQWLEFENCGLPLIINNSMIRYKSFSAVYKGYRKEDLGNKFKFIFDNSSTSLLEINAMKVYGSSKGIFTKLTAFFDPYCNS